MFNSTRLSNFGEFSGSWTSEKVFDPFTQPNGDATLTFKTWTLVHNPAKIDGVPIAAENITNTTVVEI